MERFEDKLLHRGRNFNGHQPALVELVAEMVQAALLVRCGKGMGQVPAGPADIYTPKEFPIPLDGMIVEEKG